MFICRVESSIASKVTFFIFSKSRNFKIVALENFERNFQIQLAKSYIYFRKDFFSVFRVWFGQKPRNWNITVYGWGSWWSSFVSSVGCVFNEVLDFILIVKNFSSWRFANKVEIRNLFQSLTSYFGFSGFSGFNRVLSDSVCRVNCFVASQKTSFSRTQHAAVEIFTIQVHQRDNIWDNVLIG